MHFLNLKALDSMTNRRFIEEFKRWFDYEYEELKRHRPLATKREVADSFRGNELRLIMYAILEWERDGEGLRLEEP